jgi:hypothetical protein
VRIALERLQGQRVHAAAHVGVASRNPHPHARRNTDHRRAPAASATTAAASVAASTAPVILIRAPLANSIPIAPPTASSGDADPDAICIGAKPIVTGYLIQSFFVQAALLTNYIAALEHRHAARLFGARHSAGLHRSGSDVVSHDVETPEHLFYPRRFFHAMGVGGSH